MFCVSCAREVSSLHVVTTRVRSRHDVKYVGHQLTTLEVVWSHLLQEVGDEEMALLSMHVTATICVGARFELLVFAMGLPPVR